LVSLTHALILDQCYKGRGYPVSISEAHQQAVINGSDRQTFKDMLSSALTRQGLPTYTSEKTRSKRLAWL
jgi:NurA-like 5'-3' nuclease